MQRHFPASRTSVFLYGVGQRKKRKSLKRDSDGFENFKEYFNDSDIDNKDEEDSELEEEEDSELEEEKEESELEEEKEESEKQNEERKSDNSKLEVEERKSDDEEIDNEPKEEEEIQVEDNQVLEEKSEQNDHSNNDDNEDEEEVENEQEEEEDKSDCKETTLELLRPLPLSATDPEDDKELKEGEEEEKSDLKQEWSSEDDNEDMDSELEEEEMIQEVERRSEQHDKEWNSNDNKMMDDRLEDEMMDDRLEDKERNSDDSNNEKEENTIQVENKQEEKKKNNSKRKKTRKVLRMQSFTRAATPELVTIGKKRYQRLRVHEPDQVTPNVRRSKRKKLGPIEPGEMIEYKHHWGVTPSHEIGAELKYLLRPLPTQKEIKPRAMHTKKNDENQCLVVEDSSSGKKIKERIVTPLASIVPTNINGESLQPEDNVYYQKYINSESMACGYMTMKKYSKKPPVLTGKNSFTFHVIKGSVTLTIHDQSFSVSSKSWFTIPHNTLYSISNDKATTADIMYIINKS